MPQGCYPSTTLYIPFWKSNANAMGLLMFSSVDGTIKINQLPNGQTTTGRVHFGVTYMTN